MRKKQLIPMALASLLLASPLAMAEAAHHPEQAGEEVAPAATAVAPSMERSGEAAAGTASATTEGSGMMMPGMMQKHQDVVNRLDLIDARLVKIEALLERLMQR